MAAAVCQFARALRSRECYLRGAVAHLRCSKISLLNYLRNCTVCEAIQVDYSRWHVHLGDFLRGSVQTENNRIANVLRSKATENVSCVSFPLLPHRILASLRFDHPG